MIQRWGPRRQFYGGSPRKRLVRERTALRGKYIVVWPGDNGGWGGVAEGFHV